MLEIVTQNFPSAQTSLNDSKGDFESDSDVDSMEFDEKDWQMVHMRSENEDRGFLEFEDKSSVEMEEDFNNMAIIIFLKKA
jgi:hypothetical protein